jgi:hypothetical protein
MQETTKKFSERETSENLFIYLLYANVIIRTLFYDNAMCFLYFFLTFQNPPMFCQSKTTYDS